MKFFKDKKAEGELAVGILVFMVLALTLAGLFSFQTSLNNVSEELQGIEMVNTLKDERIYVEKSLKQIGEEAFDEAELNTRGNSHADFANYFQQRFHGKFVEFQLNEKNKGLSLRLERRENAKFSYKSFRQIVEYDLVLTEESRETGTRINYVFKFKEEFPLGLSRP